MAQSGNKVANDYSRKMIKLLVLLLILIEDFGLSQSAVVG